MATGTGKTRMVIVLKRAGWVRNVHFLAEWRVLLKQAAGEFKKHLPHETVCNLLPLSLRDMFVSRNAAFRPTVETVGFQTAFSVT
jgi:type I site-specific restriction endonuclease